MPLFDYSKYNFTVPTVPFNPLAKAVPQPTESDYEYVRRQVSGYDSEGNQTMVDAKDANGNPIYDKQLKSDYVAQPAQYQTYKLPELGAVSPVTSVGLNPGNMTIKPYYQTTNPQQSQYSWASRSAPQVMAPVVPGKMSNNEFINSVYQQDLGRAPEQGGLDYWLQQLQGGESQSDVEAGIRNSAEYQQRMNTVSPSTAQPGEKAWGGQLDWGPFDVHTFIKGILSPTSRTMTEGASIPNLVPKAGYDQAPYSQATPTAPVTPSGK